MFSLLYVAYFSIFSSPKILIQGFLIVCACNCIFPLRCSEHFQCITHSRSPLSFEKSFATIWCFFLGTPPKTSQLLWKKPVSRFLKNPVSRFKKTPVSRFQKASQSDDQRYPKLKNQSVPFSHPPQRWAPRSNCPLNCLPVVPSLPNTELSNWCQESNIFWK